MEQFKNKCCNHQGGSTTNPPITNFKPWGQLEPGKDPGNITQSCFTLNKLPNIETVKELAFELCNVQQAFDKCPQYYTKSNFDALIDTVTKAFFHLYVKLAEVTETPWFEDYAELDLDPVEKAKKENKKFPGFYLIKDAGEYLNFKDINGDILNVYESDLIDHIIFFKPVFDLGFNFLGYEKVSTQIKGIQDIYNTIKVINNNIVTINKSISNIKSDILSIGNRVTVLEGKTVVLQQPVLYSELVNLINSNSLKPGLEYRITNYTFTTTVRDTESAGHDFDIIVVADTTNTLNENARAVAKEGDTYFENSNLTAWEIKYTIYNNKNVHEWADSVKGKGVIYWMKDEFDNEAGYDFKNLIYKINDKSVYTFSKLDDTDLSISGNDCYSNYIAPYFTNCLHLPENIIWGSRCKLGTACYKVQILNGIYIDIESTQNCHIKDCSNVHIFNGDSASITFVSDSILENVENGSLCHIAKSKVTNITGSDVCGIVGSNILNINFVSIINNNSYGNVNNWNQNYKNIYINGLKDKTIILSDILDDSYMLNGHRGHCVHIRSEEDLTITV